MSTSSTTFVDGRRLFQERGNLSRMCKSATQFRNRIPVLKSVSNFAISNWRSAISQLRKFANWAEHIYLLLGNRPSPGSSRKELTAHPLRLLPTEPVSMHRNPSRRQWCRAPTQAHSPLSPVLKLLWTHCTTETTLCT